jgi:uncharacterized protein (DUF1499 family)
MALLGGCASGPGGAVKSADESGVATLAACPSRPSCVVSRADAGMHAVEALSFDGPAANAWARLSDILTNMPRTRVVSADAHYLHAIQESSTLHFTDDVEFLLDPSSGRIDVRSCSRAGYFDFGVNRARVESIRSALNAPQ